MVIMSKASKKEWRKNNLDKVKQYRLVWRKNNPDKIKPHKQYRQEWVKNNLDRIHLYRLTRYQLTSDQYDKMIVSQDNKCMICHRSFSEYTIHIDHDHKSGMVRGLLCFRCNLFLGQIEDSTEILERSIQYLKK